MADSDSAISRPQLWALSVAWVLALGLVLAAAGYVGTAHLTASPEPLISLALPDAEPAGAAAEDGEGAAPAEPAQPTGEAEPVGEAVAELPVQQPAQQAVASAAPSGEASTVADPPVPAETAEAAPQSDLPTQDQAALDQAVPDQSVPEGPVTAEEAEVAATATETVTGDSQAPEPTAAIARNAGQAPAVTLLDADQVPQRDAPAATEEDEAEAVVGGAPVADDAAPDALPDGREIQRGEDAPTETQSARLEAPAWRRHGELATAPADRPRIAIVMTGLGLSAASTEAAIRELPSTVTLSFTPYSRRLNDWIALARANDHEVMLDLPMEPTSFPDDDPGPYALLTVLTQAENQKRLEWLLGRGKAFVGVAAVMGSRFTASELHMLPVLETLKEQGLIYLDNRSTGESLATPLAGRIGLPHVTVDRNLDSDQASRIAINARLSEMERLALEHGFSVALGQPYPVTIERVRDWSNSLADRGYALVPITTLAGAERRPQLTAGQ